MRKVLQQHKTRALVRWPGVCVCRNVGKFFGGKSEPNKSRLWIGVPKLGHRVSQHGKLVFGTKRDVTEENRPMLLQKTFDGFCQGHLGELKVLRGKTGNRSHLVRVDPIKRNRSFDGHAVARDASRKPEEHLECPSQKAVIRAGEELLLQPAAPAQRYRLSCNASYQGRDESEQVAGFRLSIDVHLEAITLEGKSDHFLQVVKSILHVNILCTLLSSILIDVENFTDMSAPANLAHQQLGLNGP